MLQRLPGPPAHHHRTDLRGRYDGGDVVEARENTGGWLTGGALDDPACLEPIADAGSGLGE
jgi:hypothetical protein